MHLPPTPRVPIPTVAAAAPSASAAALVGTRVKVNGLSYAFNSRRCVAIVPSLGGGSLKVQVAWQQDGKAACDKILFFRGSSCNGRAFGSLVYGQQRSKPLGNAFISARCITGGVVATTPASTTSTPASDTSAPGGDNTTPAGDTTTPATTTTPASDTIAAVGDATTPAGDNTTPATTTAPAGDNTTPATTTTPASDNTTPAGSTSAPSEYPDLKRITTGACGSYRQNPCQAGSCFDSRARSSFTCICPPKYQQTSNGCARVSESREVQEVTGDDWTCKDVYSMFGLTLKEFVGMNQGIDCSKVISTKYVNVKEYFPACSALYYVQPNDTCASVAKFLDLSEEDLWRYNPGMINSCSRLPAFRSLCVEREPAKANWECVSRALAPGVVNWKRFAVANGASTLDLVRLNPWLAFRDAESETDTDYVCVSATYS
ncbi:unnamed protein product [Closterium sp. Yama58-4]|nr:unnamed protein product [Closterium sp. Yama58-4]